MNLSLHKILFHDQVLSKDLQDLDLHEIEKIFRAIKDKLAVNPVQFGKPLRADFKGYSRFEGRFLQSHL